MTHSDVITELNRVAARKPRDPQHLSRFFKTGAGQYGEGDIFLGVPVPELRRVAAGFYELPLAEVVRLLQQPVHEQRFIALVLMVTRYRSGSETVKRETYNAYLVNTRWINNWDLVDTSAEHIVGPETYDDPTVPLRLADSANLWERRIGMLACFYDIKRGNSARAFKVIDVLKNDDHDLIQKAVGWMLREIGKRCAEKTLTDWLKADHQYQTLPRTTLRYAIERLTPDQKQYFMRLKRS